MLAQTLNIRSDRERGSLLLDMLVAFAIISIALVVVVEAFVTSQKANRVARAQADAAQSLFFLLEDMTSEVWLSDSFKYDLTSATCRGLYMRRVNGVNDQYPDDVCYYAAGSGDEQRIMKQVIGHHMGADGVTIETDLDDKKRDSNLEITPPTMRIDKFNIELHGYDHIPAEKYPTKLLVVLEATPTTVDENSQVPLNLQTTITAKFKTQ